MRKKTTRERISFKDGTKMERDWKNGRRREAIL